MDVHNPTQPSSLTTMSNHSLTPQLNDSPDPFQRQLPIPFLATPVSMPNSSIQAVTYSHHAGVENERNHLIQQNLMLQRHIDMLQQTIGDKIEYEKLKNLFEEEKSSWQDERKLMLTEIESLRVENSLLKTQFDELSKKVNLIQSTLIDGEICTLLEKTIKFNVFSRIHNTPSLRTLFEGTVQLTQDEQKAWNALKGKIQIITGNDLLKFADNFYLFKDIRNDLAHPSLQSSTGTALRSSMEKFCRNYANNNNESVDEEEYWVVLGLQIVNLLVSFWGEESPFKMAGKALKPKLLR